ncbi:MAG: hypothetical protein QM813_15885, partial [Verrucomicrobiota bacterium]
MDDVKFPVAIGPTPVQVNRRHFDAPLFGKSPLGRRSFNPAQPFWALRHRGQDLCSIATADIKQRFQRAFADDLRRPIMRTGLTFNPITGAVRILSCFPINLSQC